jgi:hypothetical protein
VAGKRLINLPLGLASLLYEALTVVAISTLIVMRRERIVKGFLRLVAAHSRVVRAREPQGLRHLSARRGRAAQARPAARTALGLVPWRRAQIVGDE